MKTKAELFQETLPDESEIFKMVTLVHEAGGDRFGKNAYKVEFDDGSYYIIFVFRPQNQYAYFNGSAKTHFGVME